MLQLFQMNVAKVYQNVAYVAVVVYVCCTSPFPMFHLCFWTYCCKCIYLDIVYVSHICCKCFIWILRMFAMVFNYFSCAFQVFQQHVSNVSFVFRCMLQVLHLDASKVDQVLHMLQYT
jgi:hypothetical protein